MNFSTANVERILAPAIELIYPRICQLCSARLAANSIIICSVCWKALGKLEKDFLDLHPSTSPKVSGAPRAKSDGSVSFHSRPKPIFCLSEYVNPLLDMIHLFKYQGQTQLGLRLARRLLLRHRRAMIALKADFLIPTPLHISDLRRRGFNQARILSDTLSEGLKVPSRPKLISKPIRTKHQTGLNAEERLYNLAGAFYTESSELKGARVLLVDDVVTTGSTIGEVGLELERAGAKIIGAISLASAQTEFSITDENSTDDR